MVFQIVYSDSFSVTVILCINFPDHLLSKTVMWEVFEGFVVVIVFMRHWSPFHYCKKAYIFCDIYTISQFLLPTEKVEETLPLPHSRSRIILLMILLFCITIF